MAEEERWAAMGAVPRTQPHLPARLPLQFIALENAIKTAHEGCSDCLGVLEQATPQVGAQGDALGAARLACLAGSVARERPPDRPLHTTPSPAAATEPAEHRLPADLAFLRELPPSLSCCFAAAAAHANGRCSAARPPQALAPTASLLVPPPPHLPQLPFGLWEVSSAMYLNVPVRFTAAATAAAVQRR